MPFEQACPRSLTAASVRSNASAESGLYGISNSREWIFIGEADNIQASLLRHLQEPNTRMMKRRPTGFVFEVCRPPQRPFRWNALVREYQPSCNRNQASGLVDSPAGGLVDR